MEKAVNTASTGAKFNVAALSKLKIKRKFEIFVEEYNEEGCPDGQGRWQPVKTDPKLGGTGGNPVIEVESPTDLQEKQKFYHDIGQRFRIVREIDPPTPDDLRRAAAEQGINIEIDRGPENPTSNNVVQPCPQPNPVQAAAVVQISAPVAQAEPIQKIKPRIVTIGDIQIKYDGNKVYQKQWIRLSAAEAANFRIVNDANNKIFPITGKHIEAKRWVLVEDESADDLTEEIVNG